MRRIATARRRGTSVDRSCPSYGWQPHAAHPAHGTHAAAPAGPEDLALLAQQAAFDRMMQLRAELQREANALRDLAMEQVKRDDSVMSQWIKLI